MARIFGIRPVQSPTPVECRARARAATDTKHHHLALSLSLSLFRSSTLYNNESSHIKRRQRGESTTRGATGREEDVERRELLLREKQREKICRLASRWLLRLLVYSLAAARPTSSLSLSLSLSVPLSAVAVERECRRCRPAPFFNVERERERGPQAKEQTSERDRVARSQLHT